MNRKLRLVAGLITGNEEDRIARCITSYRQICDTIVVIRAIGSLAPDRTLEIAKEMGCDVGEYFNSPLCSDWPHLDDFSRARNQAFAAAYDLAGEDGWVMWADVDDVLPSEQVEPHLTALVECPEDCDWILTDYVIPEQGKRAPRERFFRHRKAWWWRPVHENLHPPTSIKIWSRRDLETAHHMPPLGIRQSNERNTRILEFHDAFTPNLKFYLHYEKMIKGEREEAIRRGAEALALKSLDGVHRYETMINMSNMTDGETAMRFAAAAEKLDPARREAIALQASILMDRGKPGEALATLDRMAKVPTPSFPQWTHKAEYYGWKADRLRAWALRLGGDPKEAFAIEQRLLANSTGTKISLLHATRGNPMLAAQTMSVWLSRASNPAAVEHIFAIDGDDTTAAALTRFGGVAQTGTGAAGAWSLAAEHAAGELLVEISDGLDCPPGWDSILAENAKGKRIITHNEVKEIIKSII